MGRFFALKELQTFTRIFVLGPLASRKRAATALTGPSGGAACRRA
jgi:hypothetical protein